MKYIIDENYASIVKRGLISSRTTHSDFIDKLYEELQEVVESDELELPEELADVILTALNYSKHFGIDIESELKLKIQKNYQRTD